MARSNHLDNILAILKILCTGRGALPPGRMANSLTGGVQGAMAHGAMRVAEPPSALLQPLEIRQDSTPFGALRLRAAPRSERFCIPSFVQVILHLAIESAIKLSASSAV